MINVQIPRTGLMHVLTSNDHHLYPDWRDELIELSSDYGISEYLSAPKETPEETLLAQLSGNNSAGRAKRLLSYYIDPYFITMHFLDFKKLTAREVLYKLDAHFSTKVMPALIRSVRQIEETISKSQTTNPLRYAESLSKCFRDLGALGIVIPPQLTIGFLASSMQRQHPLWYSTFRVKTDSKTIDNWPSIAEVIQSAESFAGPPTSHPGAAYPVQAFGATSGKRNKKKTEVQ